VILICARCHLKGDRALSNPVLRVERRGVDTELAHRFVRGIDVRLVALEIDKRYWNTIELHFVFVSDSAVDPMCTGRCSAQSYVVGASHARSKVHK